MSIYDRISFAHPTGETEVLRVAARAAEDAGDFEGALRLVRQLPPEISSKNWVGQLEAAAGMPPSAGAPLAYGLVNAALRWALERPAGGCLEDYARLLLTTLGVHAPERERRLAAVASSDPVVVDAGLFDGGLFAGYLASGIGSSLLRRVGPVGRWAQCPASVWESRHQGSRSMVLHDRWTSTQVECALWPGADASVEGELLYGRLVPITGAVMLAFAVSPVRVDQRCAARLLRARRRTSGPQERIRAVAHSRRRALAAAGRFKGITG